MPGLRPGKSIVTRRLCRFKDFGHIAVARKWSVDGGYPGRSAGINYL
jgi:hypothetical protein